MDFLLLTQSLDANLLQILPGDVCDIVYVIIALIGQGVVVLFQSQHPQPIKNVVLKKKRRLNNGYNNPYWPEFYRNASSKASWPIKNAVPKEDHACTIE